MDENSNQNEERVTEKKEPICANRPVWKCILTGALVFAGAFCAFYVVADWHYKTMLQMPPKMPYGRLMEDFSKSEMKNFENFMGKEGKKLRKISNIIHIQNTGNEYRVIIDLRAFDNNENNLQVKTDDNILTITGRTIRKSKNDEQISEFQQSYLFGNNVKLENMTKNTYGNYYVINIPIVKNNSEDEE